MCRNPRRASEASASLEREALALRVNDVSAPLAREAGALLYA